MQRQLRITFKKNSPNAYKVFNSVSQSCWMEKWQHSVRLWTEANVSQPAPHTNKQEVKFSMSGRWTLCFITQKAASCNFLFPKVPTLCMCPRHSRKPKSWWMKTGQKQQQLQVSIRAVECESQRKSSILHTPSSYTHLMENQCSAVNHDNIYHAINNSL